MAIVLRSPLTQARQVAVKEKLAWRACELIVATVTVLTWSADTPSTFTLSGSCNVATSSHAPGTAVASGLALARVCDVPWPLGGNRCAASPDLCVRLPASSNTFRPKQCFAVKVTKASCCPHKLRASLPTLIGNARHVVIADTHRPPPLCRFQHRAFAGCVRWQFRQWQQRTRHGLGCSRAARRPRFRR